MQKDKSNAKLGNQRLESERVSIALRTVNSRRQRTTTNCFSQSRIARQLAGLPIKSMNRSQPWLEMMRSRITGAIVPAIGTRRKQSHDNFGLIVPMLGRLSFSVIDILRGKIMLPATTAFIASQSGNTTLMLRFATSYEAAIAAFKRQTDHRQKKQIGNPAKQYAPRCRVYRAGKNYSYTIFSVNAFSVNANHGPKGANPPRLRVEFQKVRNI
jgi:hypothetical protein